MGPADFIGIVEPVDLALCRFIVWLQDLSDGAMIAINTRHELVELPSELLEFLGEGQVDRLFCQRFGIAEDLEMVPSLIT